MSKKTSHCNTYLRMHNNCAVCGQPMEIEPSFYYGTGYVSYALSVAVTVASFLACWMIMGPSLQDNRLFWRMGFTAVLLNGFRPCIMGFQQTIWLAFLFGTKKSSCL